MAYRQDYSEFSPNDPATAELAEGHPLASRTFSTKTAETSIEPPNCLPFPLSGAIDFVVVAPRDGQWSSFRLLALDPPTIRHSIVRWWALG